MEQLIIIVDSPTEIVKDNDGKTIALIDNEALEVIVYVGGASTLSGLYDTNVSSIVNHDFIVYDTATKKWINLSASVLDLATQTSVNNVTNDLNTHILDSTNPHMVTAAQTLALPLAGGTMDEGAVINSNAVMDNTGIGHIFDTVNAAGSAGDKLASFKTNNVEKLNLSLKPSSRGGADNLVIKS